MKFFGITLISLFLCVGAFAQTQSPEEQEKQIRKSVDAQIESMTQSLDLEYWQVFYVDSIMMHDYTAMMEEIQVLSAARYGNSEAYQAVQDKWVEQMYQSFQKVFNEEQWAKYLKIGAARAKKARDKRMAKRAQ